MKPHYHDGVTKRHNRPVIVLSLRVTLRDNHLWRGPVSGDWTDNEPLMVSGINELIRAADTRIIVLMDPDPTFITRENSSQTLNN